MKRTIRLTESDLKQVIKESVTKILKENEEMQFDNDCNTLMDLFQDVVGGETLRELLFNTMGDISFKNDDDFQTIWDYDKNSMQSLLYNIVNYDLITLRDGAIDVENSNHPDIAEIMQKYCDYNMILYVERRLYY